MQISSKKRKSLNCFGINHVKYLMGAEEITLKCNQNYYSVFIIRLIILPDWHPV
jgi:hypothetical protein